MIQDDSGLAKRINGEQVSCLDEQHEEIFRKRLRDDGGVTPENIDDLEELLEYISDGARYDILLALLEAEKSKLPDAA